MEPLLVSVQVFSGSGFALSDDFFFFVCFVLGTFRISRVIPNTVVWAPEFHSKYSEDI